MPAGILEVKLGAALKMPTRRIHQLLEQARRDCCKARNAAMLRWYVWRRANPHWQPGDPYDAPEPKIKRKSKPRADGKTPKDSPIGPRLFLSRELYAAATGAAPKLSANLASSCVQEVISRLKANTPYDHDGEARWTWQAVLGHEVNLPTWRGGRIPMPRKDARLTYTDDECTLRFPLLSKASGYKTLSPMVRLLAADLTRGNRRLLQRLAKGEQRLADSQLVEKKGKWFAQLCYEVPVTAHGCDADRVLTLLPAQPDDKWPFVLQWTNTEGEDRAWYVGKARPLVAEYRRLKARDRALRYRSRDGRGRGHGKERVYKVLRPITRAIRDMSTRFEKQLVADIVAFALREQCGTILYREPTMPVRDRGWFAQEDVPFGWATFEARLKFKCECAGLEYSSRPRIGMKEWRPKDDKRSAS